MNELQVPQGAGSGFVWDRQGHIVTNYHVVKGSNSLLVSAGCTDGGLVTLCCRTCESSEVSPPKGPGLYRKCLGCAVACRHAWPALGAVLVLTSPGNNCWACC